MIVLLCFVLFVGVLIGCLYSYNKFTNFTKLYFDEFENGDFSNVSDYTKEYLLTLKRRIEIHIPESKDRSTLLDFKNGDVGLKYKLDKNTMIIIINRENDMFNQIIFHLNNEYVFLPFKFSTIYEILRGEYDK